MFLLDLFHDIRENGCRDDTLGFQSYHLLPQMLHLYVSSDVQFPLGTQYPVCTMAARRFFLPNRLWG